MSSRDKKEAASQEFLDANQYSLKSILRYERIFGHTWVSTGGENTTKEFCLLLNLKPGEKMLDIGCGTGGPAFYMARQYGCIVRGVDLSSNMISIAKYRLSRETENIRERVSFEIGDILKVNYPDNEFDIIYSRDTILHIKDKEYLFKRILPWLKPGGMLLITDYAKGDQDHSLDFIEYVKQRGYYLTTVNEYGNVLKKAGFRDVEAHDKSKMLLSILEEELKYFIPSKEAFILDFSEKDYNEIVGGWQSKISRVKAGDQAWGLFICKK